MSMSPEQFLLAEIGRRDATDYRFRWGTYFGWAVLTGGLYSIYGTLKLVERRVDHVRRRLAVSTSLWHALAAKADSLRVRGDVQEGLDNLSRIHAQIETYERKNRRNAQTTAAVRAVLLFATFAGIAMFSALYDPDLGVAGQPDLVAVGSLIFDAGVIGLLVHGAITNAALHRDFNFLDTWETSWAENVEWVMYRLGMAPSFPARPPQPTRSTATYVLLTVFSLGVFSILWRASLMGDGNRHFDHDDEVEDAILAAMDLRGSPAPQTGLPVLPPS
ncbi:MAG TPA: hypothetical protein VM841_10620 [Actinomycetota bacterium]|nr:hypothetical protein [Actinomycetota bacterium]